MSIPAETMLNCPLTFDAPIHSFSAKDPKGHRLTFTSPVLSKQDLETRIHNILEHIKKHPDAMTLLQESLNNGSISLIFQDPNIMSAVGTWNKSTRNLSISSMETDLRELLNIFIFELCNSVNCKLHMHTIDNYIDAEDFALKIEMAEYESYRRTVQIMFEGIEKHDWPKSKTHREAQKPCALEHFLIYTQQPRPNYNGISHFSSYKISYCLMCIDSLDDHIERHLVKQKLLLSKEALNIFSQQNLHMYQVKLSSQIEEAQIKRVAFKKEILVIENNAKLWINNIHTIHSKKSPLEQPHEILKKPRCIFPAFTTWKYATTCILATAAVGVSIWASMYKQSNT